MTKKKRRMIKWLIMIAVVLAGLVAGVLFSDKSEEENPTIEKITEEIFENKENVENPADSVELGEGLKLLQLGSYEGIYMEDGSDETVSDVMMIVVKNNGEKTLQYAELFLEYEGMTAEFSFSTLRPGAKMMVLEKNRQSYPREELFTASLKNVVYFEEEPKMYSEMFEISTMEGAMNVKNISSTLLKGPIYVYYKNIVDDLYHGGITYRAVIKDNLEPGEIRQIVTRHFSTENSELMFVTYAP